MVTRFFYDGGTVSRAKLKEALDFFLSLEPTSSVPLSEHMQYYEDNCQKYDKEILMAENAIKKYGEQIEPMTIENMRKEFYEVIGTFQYRRTGLCYRKRLEWSWSMGRMTVIDRFYFLFAAYNFQV